MQLHEVRDKSFPRFFHNVACNIRSADFGIVRQSQEFSITKTRQTKRSIVILSHKNQASVNSARRLTALFMASSTSS